MGASKPFHSLNLKHQYFLYYQSFWGLFALQLTDKCNRVVTDTNPKQWLTEAPWGAGSAMLLLLELTPLG